jgi:hypothetical protein
MVGIPLERAKRASGMMVWIPWPLPSRTGFDFGMKTRD